MISYVVAVVILVLLLAIPVVAARRQSKMWRGVERSGPDEHKFQGSISNTSPNDMGGGG